MTRKDYELIAAAIRAAHGSEKPAGHNSGVWENLDALCERLAADNPRFDRRRFVAACGVGGQP